MTADLIPLDPAKTRKFQSLRTGRMEVWEAGSRDGWAFRRLEMEGTPWEATHDAFPGWSMLYGSLRKARQFAPAQLALDLAQVEKAAGHG